MAHVLPRLYVLISPFVWLVDKLRDPMVHCCGRRTVRAADFWTVDT